MGSFSIWHILIVAIVVILLFGRGKISDLMGDVAKGIKSFKKGLSEDDDTKAVDHKPGMTMPAQKAEDQTKVG